MILQKGLRNDVEIIDIEDMQFFKDLYRKYGDQHPITLDFIRNHIYGKNSDGTDRDIYISTNPDIKLYSVPERLKFFMKSLYHVVISGKLDELESVKAQQIFSKYYNKVKKSKVCIFEIDAIAPPILNELVGNYDLTKDYVLDILANVFNNYDPNIGIEQNIDPKFISLKEEMEIEIDDFDDNIIDHRLSVFV